MMVPVVVGPLAELIVTLIPGIVGGWLLGTSTLAMYQRRRRDRQARRRLLMRLLVIEMKYDENPEFFTVARVFSDLARRPWR